MKSGSGSKRIHVGIGGWTYAPWRSEFYPPGLAQARELEYASSRLGAIEINATYYRSFQAASFAKWHDATPDGFIFSLKAPRFATHRKNLAQAGESVERFMQSGLSALGEKLGPIVWQLPPGKVFDAEDVSAFFSMLPRELDGQQVRHVLDARHRSFMSADYLNLARQHRVATVFTDADAYPSFADLTADLIYVRLMRCEEAIKTGYAPDALERWAQRAQMWADGGEPTDLPRVMSPEGGSSRPRPVFVFFINGAKLRAPAAACELQRCLAGG